MPNTHSIQGYGAPKTAPAAVNAHYLDLLSGTPYVAVGTKSREDWRPLSGMAPVQSVNGKTGKVNIPIHEVGDALLSLRSPGDKYVAASSILAQSEFPALFALVGLIEAGPASTAKWRPRASGLASGNHNAIRTDGSGVWVATGPGSDKIMRSADNGATWAAIDVLGIGNCLATDGNGVWLAAGSSGKVLRSADNGLSWTSIDVSAIGQPYGIDIAPSGVAIWGGGSGKAARSTDFGLTWTAVTSGFGVTKINAVRTDGAGNWVMVGNAEIITYSANDGASFTLASVSNLNSANLNNVDTDGAGVWICGSGETDRIGLSVNGGAAWAGQSGVSGRRVRHIAGGEWISGNAYGFKRSEDGGQSWSANTSLSGGIADIARGDDGVLIGVPYSGDLIEPAPSYPYDETTQFKVPGVATMDGVGAYVRALP